MELSQDFWERINSLWLCLFISTIETRLPASRSSSIRPKGCFLFLHPKVKGGRVSGDKSENHGLKIHFKSFQAILDNVVFMHTPSPP